MNFNRKTRHQKLIESIGLFFEKMCEENGGDDQQQTICLHLLSLGGNAQGHVYIKMFLEIWDAQYPEESPLDPRELTAALVSLEDNISLRIEKEKRAFAEVCSTGWKYQVINGGLSKNPYMPNADLGEITNECVKSQKLRVINGGLSANPDTPYVGKENVHHEYIF